MVMQNVMDFSLSFFFFISFLISGIFWGFNNQEIIKLACCCKFSTFHWNELMEIVDIF